MTFTKTSTGGLLVNEVSRQNRKNHHTHTQLQWSWTNYCMSEWEKHGQITLSYDSIECVWLWVQLMWVAKRDKARVGGEGKGGFGGGCIHGQELPKLLYRKESWSVQGKGDLHKNKRHSAGALWSPLWGEITWCPIIFSAENKVSSLLMQPLDRWRILCMSALQNV